MVHGAPLGHELPAGTRTHAEAKHHLKQRQMALDSAARFDAMISKLVNMQNAMEQQQ